jgi:hypothetical protein
MPARNAAAVPRPPLADRLTPAQWRAIDAVAAVLVAMSVVFDLHVLHGFRFEVPTVPVGIAGAAATLPVAVRRIWPLPVLAVVTTAVASLTALGHAQLDVDVMLGMAIYTVAVSSRRPVAVAALRPRRVRLRRAAGRRERVHAQGTATRGTALRHPRHRSG